MRPCLSHQEVVVCLLYQKNERRAGESVDELHFGAEPRITPHDFQTYNFSICLNLHAG